MRICNVQRHYIYTYSIYTYYLYYLTPPSSLGHLTDSSARGSPAEVGNILSWRLIMKYSLRSFSPFRLFKKGCCQFLAKECTQILVTALEACPTGTCIIFFFRFLRAWYIYKDKGTFAVRIPMFGKTLQHENRC